MEMCRYVAVSSLPRSSHMHRCTLSAFWISVLGSRLNGPYTLAPARFPDPPPGGWAGLDTLSDSASPWLSPPLSLQIPAAQVSLVLFGGRVSGAAADPVAGFFISRSRRTGSGRLMPW